MTAVTIVPFVLIACVALLQLPVTGLPHWSYEQTDAEWANLVDTDGSKPYASCVGTKQSPVNMENIVIDPTLQPLHAAWADFATFTVKNNEQQHTIQIDSTDASSPRFIDPNTGIAYNFLQLHFHSPSEHTWAGAYRDLEVHLVHTDDSGNKLVVAVSFIASPFGKNSFLNQFWTQILSLSTFGAISGTLTDLSFKYTLPSNEQYATYSGSLASPPCSEIVTWYVMQEPISVSNDQLNAFRTTLGLPANDVTTFEVFGNSRRTQALNGRVIRLSVTSMETGRSPSLAERIATAAIVLACVGLVVGCAVVAAAVSLAKRQTSGLAGEASDHNMPKHNKVLRHAAAGSDETKTDPNNAA